jgi:hypothetical protein
MKKPLLTLSFLAAIITCCEKDHEGFKSSSFLIVGDSINCDYINYNPDLVFSSSLDSLDIESDYKTNVLFSINSVFIDSCDEFLANCPPNVICDCFPTIYTDYIIELTHDLEIAIDCDSTIHEFAINDTISINDKWSRKVKYPLYHRGVSDPFWTGSKEYFLGLRITHNEDTAYAWINIEINNTGFLIKELAIKE